MKTANTKQFKELLDASVEKFANDKTIAQKVANIDTATLEKKLNALEETANKTMAERVELNSLEKDRRSVEAQLREFFGARKMLDLIKKGSLPVWALDSKEQSYVLVKKATRLEFLESSLMCSPFCINEDATEKTIANVENYIEYIAAIVNSENIAELQRLLAHPVPTLNVKFQKILTSENYRTSSKTPDKNIFSARVEPILVELNRAVSLLEEFKKLEDVVSKSRNNEVAESLRAIAENVSGEKTFSAESFFDAEISKQNALIETQKQSLKEIFGLHRETPRLYFELVDLKSRLYSDKATKEEKVKLKEEISTAGLL